jgi:hypothetical protein
MAMNPVTFTASVCSLSWIDQRTGLPEHDGDGPPLHIPGAKLTFENDTLPFRFLNLLEATVSIIQSSPPRIGSYNWTPASKIYRNPSFLKIPSEPFQTFQSVTPKGDRVLFQQTAGARTVSPEIIGAVAGAAPPIVEGPMGEPLIPVAAKIGRAVAHDLLGFPPIWTTLHLTMFADGHSEGAVTCYSLFPSMNFYAVPGSGIGSKSRLTSLYYLVDSYDARANLDKWKTAGWGKLPSSPSGSCSGNPWGYEKKDLTIRTVRSGTRVV